MTSTVTELAKIEPVKIEPVKTAPAKAAPAKTAGKAKPSPEALLKEAVSEATEPEKAATPLAPKAKRRPDPFLMGVAGGGLALGALLGAGVTALSTPRPDHGVSAFAEMNAGLEAGRVEASRLNGEIERLGRSVAGLRETGEAARKEAVARGTGLTERIGKMEQGLSAKFAALGERVEQAERDQGARAAALAAQAEKRPAAVQAPVPAPVGKPEPAQTGSLAEAKPKPAIIESWAVRDVYDGTAVLEDRRRRLVEVGTGDTIPGIGRVESVERRGREWVVVTRAGLVTSQPW